jgi:(1->4)-alpha-D-glucan 1-alpha-D-glucosylmutase
LNSLSQLTLKATLPGVPDFYQGTECWDCSMVDPDNRRPVDFAGRAFALGSLEIPDWPALVRHRDDGRLKFAWTRALLSLRQQSPDLFTMGEYLPLEVRGRDRDHIIAFARRHRREAAVVTVGRWFGRFTDAGRSWPKAHDIEAEVDISPLQAAFRRDTLRISDCFEKLPVAVLTA